MRPRAGVASSWLATSTTGERDSSCVSGAPGVCVVDVAEAETVDLIALSWSQDLGNGKAQTVQQVLTTSPVPVLLLPAPAAANAP